MLADSIKPASTHPLKVTAPGGGETSLLLVKVRRLPVFRISAPFPVPPGAPLRRPRAQSDTRYCAHLWLFMTRAQGSSGELYATVNKCT